MGFSGSLLHQLLCYMPPWVQTHLCFFKALEAKVGKASIGPPAVVKACRHYDERREQHGEQTGHNRRQMINLNVLNSSCYRLVKKARWWKHISLIPALGRLRQADICEFKASLIYRASSRAAKETLSRKTIQTNKQTTTSKQYKTKNSQNQPTKNLQ